MNDGERNPYGRTAEPPGMSGVVVAEDVRKTYGGTVALDGASLSVAAGEVFALIGPNGAGKTTLVRALTGTTRPDSGTVRLLSGPPAEVERERLGLLPQDFDPPGRLTARELVRYYAGLYDDAREPAAVLADVGMADAGGTWYEDLSGGERRRVAVATALVNDPDVLFLDEPTTGVDPAGRRALWDLVADLAGGGTTVVLTTHYMAEAERLGDRVGLLADGRLVAVGPPAALVEEYGGAPRLEVDTTAAPDALAGTDYDVAAGDGGLVLRGVAAEAVGDAVAVLEERGVEYDALRWRAPDLEDVYLRLAGDRLAAEGRRAEARAGAAGLGVASDGADRANSASVAASGDGPGGDGQ